MVTKKATKKASIKAVKKAVKKAVSAAPVQNAVARALKAGISLPLLEQTIDKTAAATGTVVVATAKTNGGAGSGH